ncbi:hypothetical protein ABZP36_004051 [Zizania latifolia]
MLFRPPCSTGRGGSRSVAAIARSAPQTRVVVAAAGGSKSTPQFNATDGGNSGSAPLADVGDALEDDDVFFGHDHLMGGPVDKANWSSENTYVFCDICLEEKKGWEYEQWFHY